ncbi:MAG: undecaprenyldiphospho-muramoylpentapeptide beta-N-acetylglucosaminyltransferase [Frankiaceae bacterium]|jgi:UDP-N-acetylglucosamine--N-acetylmuramyl-(pentapeptide) pyrophosphoryl-undecaprenol N-acetylglucosamine transferase|nr:undecaprenyldiphospho-muramoylpentapeptide beta-N-acetylglucosaminyltransferase [Frankiaceae bacterium]
MTSADGTDGTLPGARVVVAGGGSGGHIEPAMALAEAVLRLAPDSTVTALGTARGLEGSVIPARGFELDLIAAAPLPRKLSMDLLRVPGRLAAATRGARRAMRVRGAQVVVGFGGYVSLPAYLAASRARIPVVVHEANARPGLANRIGARRTPWIYTASPAAALRGVRVIGMPLRRSISQLDRAAERARARAAFGLDADRPTLLVTGGSQGAMSLNRAMAGAAEALGAAGVQVLHVIGPRNAGAEPPGSADRGGPPYAVRPYIEDMAAAYAAADFVLCRGGAMTVAELTAVGLPAAYVPYEHSNGEQRLNALPVVRVGGGLLVDDAQLSASWIIDAVLPVLADPERLAAMSAAATGAGRRDADEALAREVLRAAAGGTPS